MSLTRHTSPPSTQESYIIPQLEGERITLPGSKGVFRILASAKQTNNKIAVFTSGAVLSDAPGFHYHNEAHDVFLVTKGYLKLWNGDQCRIMGPGDFAYVPPGLEIRLTLIFKRKKVVHNPEMLGPHTEVLGLIAPGDWVDFFRFVSEPFTGLLVPEFDDRDLKSILMPKIMAAKDRFDVVFQRDYQPPDVSEWTDGENILPKPLTPYFLRANRGPRWMAGGVLSRPFVTTEQTGGKFAISSIESSKYYGPTLFSKALTFKDVDHCLCVQEGALVVTLAGKGEETVGEGETVVIPSGQSFGLGFATRFVRVVSFTSGEGVEALIQRVGKPYAGFSLPDEAPGFDEGGLEKVFGELSIER
ncbi:gb [Venturia nashicola]|uniref:Gb n=1 Tax=Venturia nashicola TaxID=86259 RepID=A0A4Z1PI43_9PEZI|nr:gb [Venturia nashicola]